jgi:uncharacterized protein (UPF0335 family)
MTPLDTTETGVPDEQLETIVEREEREESEKREFMEALRR